MYLFNLLVIFLAALSSSNLLKFTAEISEKYQNTCRDLIFQNLKNQQLHSAVLCGVSLPNNSELKNLFLRTQLYHLIVVSGGHWVFLELALTAIFSRFKKSKGWEWTLFACFLFFSVWTGFQPPIVRALLAFSIGRLASGWHRWDGFQTNWLSTLLALAIFPNWISSFSLYLSALSSLAVSSWASHKTFIATFFKLASTQALLFLTALPWSPLGLASNLILGPILNFVLIPMSILACVFQAADGLVSIFLHALKIWSDVFPSADNLQLSAKPAWFFLFWGVACRQYLKQLQLWR